MIKVSITVLMLTLSINCFPQEICGKYCSGQSETLELNSDSTFYYMKRYSCTSSWNIGYWSISYDTIYLNATLILDTLKYYDEFRNINGTELIMSADKKTETIEYANFFDFINGKEYAYFSNNGINQNIYPVPNILIFRKNKIFHLDKKSKIEKKKFKGAGLRRIKPWFEQCNEK